MVNSDSKIIEMFFERKEDALKEVSEKYEGLCMKVAGNILKNPSDSAECVNDTYLALWNTIPPKKPESLSAYICRIVRNLCLKRYSYNSAQKRNSYFDSSVDELSEVLAGDSSPEKEVEASELTAALNAFLETLNPVDRVVFTRRYYMGDSYDDIAEAAGISSKNVSVRLTRVRSKLRDYLTERGFM